MITVRTNENYDHETFLMNLDFPLEVSYGEFKRDVIDRDYNQAVLVQYFNDPDGDNSWIGTFSDERKGWYVDTRTGILHNSKHQKIRNGLPVLHQFDSCERYFIPERFSLPGKGWDHVPAEMRKQVIKEYGSLRNADLSYMVRDYQRIVSYGDSWHYIGIAVTLYSFGAVIGRDSLWGIESDSGKPYFKEIIGELIGESVYRMHENDCWIMTEDFPPFDSTDADGLPLNTSPSGTK